MKAFILNSPTSAFIQMVIKIIQEGLRCPSDEVDVHPFGQMNAIGPGQGHQAARIYANVGYSSHASMTKALWPRYVSL